MQVHLSGQLSGQVAGPEPAWQEVCFDYFHRLFLRFNKPPTCTCCRCILFVDECATNLHNCSRFATCIDKPIGYDCKCLDKYNDNNPSLPGTECSYSLLFIFVI